MTPPYSTAVPLATDRDRATAKARVRAIRALFLIHFSRAWRPLSAALIALSVFATLSSYKRGWTAGSTLPWLVGAAIALMISPGMAILREKFDGSLRYFGSLPVRGEDHAIARALVSSTLSIPGAVIVGFALKLGLRAPSGSVVAAIIGSWIFLSASSLGLVALQIKTKVGKGLGNLLYGLLSFFVLLEIFDFAAKRHWLEPIRDFLLSPVGLASLSAGVWIAFLAFAWLAFRSIARRTVSYRGEPLEP